MQLWLLLSKEQFLEIVLHIVSVVRFFHWILNFLQLTHLLEVLEGSSGFLSGEVCAKSRGCGFRKGYFLVGWWVKLWVKVFSFQIPWDHLNAGLFKICSYFISTSFVSKNRHAFCHVPPRHCTVVKNLWILDLLLFV